jgi:alpha-beta hydrolase superfamily lysophospholipase
MAGDESKEVQWKTSDQVTVYGDHYPASHPPGRALLILIHQGDGSAKGDYGPIIPRLLKEGFEVLAIDSRLGGDLFGAANRTVSRNPAKDWKYCDAYPDLVTALDYAKALIPRRRVIVWGSSYSATLALRLAAERPSDFSAVLAFSPASGPPMGECQPVPYAAQVTMPALVVRPRAELDVAMRREDFEAFRKQGHQTLVANPGAHGSSALVAERTHGGVGETWKAVLDFFDRALRR